MNSKRLCKLSRKAIDELKGQDVVELDVRKLTDVTDYLLVITGRSARQVKAIAEKNNIRMPSFFGYMAYSCVVLLPLSILLTIVFL